MDQQRRDERAGTDSVQGMRVAGYRVGAVIVDAGQRCALRDGHTIPLGALSFELLLALVRRAPATVSANTLLDEVWPNAVVGPDTLTQRVKLLRAALGDDADHPRYIESLRGKGYRIVAPVETLTETPPPREAGVPTPKSGGDARARPQMTPENEASALPATLNAPPAKGARGGFNFPVAVAGIVVALVASMAIAWGLLRSRPAPQPEALAPSSGAAPETQTRPRIAVLPLETIGTDTDALFADGMHEEIISTLAQVAPSVEVVSRTTMLTFRNASPRSVPEIARALNATYIIEGSVRREADRVRLSLQLVDARTDSHVWSQSYDRTLTSALTLQSEVAQSVVSQVAGHLPMRLAQLPPPPKDPVAHDLYLRARLQRTALVVTDPPNDVQAVEATISEAIRREPTFGLAYVERFQVRMLRFAFSQGDAVSLVEQMRSDLETARRLIPDSAALMQAEGELAAVTHETDRALALFDAAEAAGLVDSYLLVVRAGVMARMGLLERAMPFLDRAVEIDPRNPTILFYKAINLMYLRRPADAIATYRHIAAQYPDRAVLANNLIEFTRVLFAGSDEGMPTASAEWLLHHGRYKEALAQVTTTAPERGPFWPGPGQQLLLSQGAGQVPVKALIEGRLNLLLGDRVAAAKNGREVLAFVAEQRENAFNRWHLRNLTAAGDLLTADNAGAIAATHEALALAPRSVDIFHWTIAASRAAETLAWAGAPDEAVDLLEQLATGIPGLPPSAIAQEPQFTTALAANSRFQALRKRLEAEMAATKL